MTMTANELIKHFQPLSPETKKEWESFRFQIGTLTNETLWFQNGTLKNSPDLRSQNVILSAGLATEGNRYGAGAGGVDGGSLCTGMKL
jgi:hypothetical protein